MTERCPGKYRDLQMTERCPGKYRDLQMTERCPGKRRVHLSKNRTALVHVNLDCDLFLIENFKINF